ncbi:MAG: DUF983 domain-containing protein, partial [Proteobacteria bacterium]|nr:DUF983 domain-containing protein [Pseudomonadota bacterium]
MAYAALRGRCPRCGRGKLYAGLLTVAPACTACGLSYTGHEQGDGPAFLGILVIGFLTATGAVIVDLKFEPPLWVHAALWLPFTIIGSLLVLRWGKAALVAT